MSKRKSSNFKVGDPVTCIKHGRGIVESVINSDDKTYTVTVHFVGTTETYTKDGKYVDKDYNYSLIKGHFRAINLVGIKDKNVPENKD